MLSKKIMIATSGISDPYFANVVLLLAGDGTNGSQTFVDSSYNNFTLTANGQAQISTSQKKYGTGSMYFDGNGDYIYIPNNAAFNFGTGDFTIEWWMYCSIAWTSMTNPGIAGQKANDSSTGWQIYRNGANNTDKVNIRIGGSGTSSDYHSNATPITSTWEHWAVTRQSGTLRWFKNGSLTATYTVTTNVTDSSSSLNVGYTATWGGYFNGYIDDLRITKGIARYTANFTPPSTGFSGISNEAPAANDPYFSDVALLLKGDGTNGSTTFTDSSSSPKTVTSYNSAQISTSVKKYGTGSINLTGSGDHLQVPSDVFNFGSSTDFTVEFWLYTTTNNRTYDQFIGQWGSQSTFQFSNIVNTVAIQDPSGTVTFGVAMSSIPVNTWTHIAYSRTGSTLKLFVNGVGYNASRNATISPNLSFPVGIGKVYDQNGYDMNGYIDDLRVTKGYAQYTTNFTPPTEAFLIE